MYTDFVFVMYPTTNLSIVDSTGKWLKWVLIRTFVGSVLTFCIDLFSVARSAELLYRREFILIADWWLARTLQHRVAACQKNRVFD